MVGDMKQIVVQLDDRTAQQLEKVAPGRSRRRSEFIRQAIARALLELAEHCTHAAYTKVPDGGAVFNPAEWADDSEALRRSRRRRA
jgi:predicted transcriptional regulator